jgi:REP element-mobilizing transposase RayT
VGEAVSFPKQMAEPPRLSEILLPHDKEIIYFVTLCVEGGRPVLANAEMFDAIKTVIKQLRKWEVMAAVIMPDHAHMIVAPVEDRDLSVGDFAMAFKRLLRKNLAGRQWKWQRGCFDRLLRSDEDLGNKWTYVQENPVRAGLVERAEDWPFYLDLNNDEKLTASPTKSEAE